MSQPEDPIERLARRTAEENDRLARQRQDEWLEASKHPIFPKWVPWLLLILLAISLALIVTGMHL